MTPLARIEGKSGSPVQLTREWFIKLLTSLHCYPE